MKVLSVRKNGFDVNEFADRVLILNPDGVTWRPAEPTDLPHPFALFFHGYNCKTEILPGGGSADNALDAARAIDSIWSGDLRLPYEPVCCLSPLLGESALEAIRFHRAIVNARRSARMYADFISQTAAPFVMIGHSLGCGQIGFAAQHLHRPAELVVWMGAAVPQYATAHVSPKSESDDFIARLMKSTLFDFAPDLERNAKKLLNVRGEDPILRGLFEKTVREKACGAHGVWPGPERIANVSDLDFRAAIRSHSHYRHYMPVWERVRDALSAGKK